MSRGGGQPALRSVRVVSLLVVSLSLLAGSSVGAQTPAAPSTETPPPTPTPTQTPTQTPTPTPRYFYQGFEYGSQSLFSPLWVFVNRGYDVLQDHVASRNVLDQNYRVNASNVLDNLAHPFSNISALGWKTFLTEEIFPLSFGAHTARWTPNYSLHLIGGGMTYTGLREWFQDQGVPLPRLWSGVTPRPCS